MAISHSKSSGAVFAIPAAKDSNMLWRGQRESGNVDNQRSFGIGTWHLGIGGVLVGAFVVYLMGGTSEQRVRAFRDEFESGEISVCIPWGKSSPIQSAD